MCCALGFVFVFWALGIDGMDLFFDIWDFYTHGLIPDQTCLLLRHFGPRGQTVLLTLIDFPYFCFIITTIIIIIFILLQNHLMSL